MITQHPTPATADQYWRMRAACHGADPDTFFPAAKAGAVRDRQVAAAKAICAGCPVREACLSWALTHLSDGIAGGMTEYERRTVRRPGPEELPVDEQLRRARTRAQVAAAGTVLLVAGRSTGSVARACGVSERTAYRWRASIVAGRVGRGA